MIYNNIRGFMDIFKGYIKKLLVEQKDTYDEDNLRLTIDALSKGMNKKKKLVSDSVTSTICLSAASRVIFMEDHIP